MNLTTARNLRGAQAQVPDNFQKYLYVYSIQNFAAANTLANGATGTGTVQIQTDSDFLLQQMTAIAKSAAGAIIADSALDVDIQITDTGSGTTFFDQPQSLRAIAGTAQLPFILPTPRDVKAGASLQATITNNTGGNLILKLSLIGRKTFLRPR